MWGLLKHCHCFPILLASPVYIKGRVRTTQARPDPAQPFDSPTHLNGLGTFQIYERIIPSGLPEGLLKRGLDPLPTLWVTWAPQAELCRSF